MKKLLLLVLFSLALSAKSQEAMPVAIKDTIPFIFVGGGGGINNICGAGGVLISVKASDNFFLRTGFGIGLWGRKFTAGFKYELKTSSSWGFGMSYSSCSGVKDFNKNVEVSDSGKTIMKAVPLQLFRASTINFTTSYKWVFNNKNNFYIDIGWSVPVESDPYIVKDGSTLTSKGKEAVHLQQPGGFLLGFGILFGLK
jgi:hypothetical protein